MKIESLTKEENELLDIISKLGADCGKLEKENKALKEKIEVLENALDIAFEDDRGCLDDLMAEAGQDK